MYLISNTFCYAHQRELNRYNSFKVKSNIMEQEVFRNLISSWNKTIPNADLVTNSLRGFYCNAFPPKICNIGKYHKNQLFLEHYFLRLLQKSISVLITSKYIVIKDELMQIIKGPRLWKNNLLEIIYHDTGWCWNFMWESISVRPDFAKCVGPSDMTVHSEYHLILLVRLFFLCDKIF